MAQTSFETSQMSRSQSIERIEAQSVRRQQIAFSVLTTFLIAALLLLHLHFSFLLGEPSKGVITILGCAFVIKIAEWIWLWRQKNGVSERAARLATAISAPAVFVLAAVLAVLTDRDDVPYFVLLAIPILQCAYRFGLLVTLSAIAASVGLIFTWSEHFFTNQPPARPAEFLESGMICLIYCLMGVLVWYLVHQLEIKQARLYSNMMELEATREKLLAEERLAAVGRLASGVAHEIRNPVAMIASSLSTAAESPADSDEREEMFAIAAREAKRLEVLTNDFLHYARPAIPQRSLFPVNEIISHVANTTRMRAAERSIEVIAEPSIEVIGNIDALQVEGALVNLGMNAIDATEEGGRITFRTHADDSMLAVEVENSGKPIPEAHLLRIFEPFFTTKPTGTGLGLAIARTVARAHGGDLWVSRNLNGSVVFTMTLRIRASQDENEEAAYGQSVDC
jgi:signal transduction histidine kinase